MGYPMKMIFKQKFTAGLLKGMILTDSLGVLDEEYAADWVRRVNANNKKGWVNYKVTSYKVVPNANLN